MRGLAVELVERDLALAFHRTLSVSAFSSAGFAGSVELHFVITPLFPHSNVSKRCYSRCALLLSCRGLLWPRRGAPAPQARRVHTLGSIPMKLCAPGVRSYLQEFLLLLYPKRIPLLCPLVPHSFKFKGRRNGGRTSPLCSPPLPVKECWASLWCRVEGPDSTTFS